MKKLTQEQINKILEEHKHWLNEDCKGWETMMADFSSCDLCGANFHDVNLSYANFHDANLNGANFRDADLYGANLSYADLYGAKEVPYIPMVCPEEGDFIGWKKVGNKIVKLRIPEDALRSSATTRKCRCNKAEVIEIYNIDGTIADERIVSSNYDSSFTYEVGKTVEVQDFDTNRWKNVQEEYISSLIDRKQLIIDVRTK